MQTVLVMLRMVKIEHSVFALPFAYSGAFLAAGGWPGWRVFLLLTLAMVAMRSFAMAFNRLADLRFDAINPRTQDRPLVTGALSVRACVLFLCAMAALFVLACFLLNPLCFTLSPVALALGALYSYTKRMTPLCHLFLGVVLGLSPVAGWLAVSPVFTLPAVLLGCAVVFWVAGFDILYACQDVDFDREQQLHSIPADYGIPVGLALSCFCHINTALFLVLAGWAGALSWPFYLVWAVVSAVLVWEHTLISPGDLRRITLAFFTANGVISLAVFLGIVLGVFIERV